MLLLLQSGGSLLVFRVQQVALHYRMLARLQRTVPAVEHLTMDAASFQAALVAPDEMIINGASYDIMQPHRHGDSVSFMALRDVEEDDLMKRIARTIGSIADDDPPPGVLDMLLLCYTLPDGLHLRFFHAQPRVLYPHLVHMLADGCRCIVVPPPEVA